MIPPITERIIPLRENRERPFAQAIMNKLLRRHPDLHRSLWRHPEIATLLLDAIVIIATNTTTGHEACFAFTPLT